MLLQIGEFSKRSGVSVRTLRYYDQMNLFNPIEIDLFTGYRYYDETQIDDIKLINELKQVGFKLDEIKKYWNKFNNEIMLKKQEELKIKLNDINKSIKKIDYLRSNIIGGKIVNKVQIEEPKNKSLY